MADEQTKPPYNKPPIFPAKYNWESLLKREGDELEAHYRHILEELAKQPGMLGEIFKKARPEIQNPATLRRLIVDLIDVEKWSSMQADVKGDIYEGLLAKRAKAAKRGSTIPPSASIQPLPPAFVSSLSASWEQVVLPKPRNRVTVERRVRTDDGHAFHGRLSDEHAVERVFVA